jgi:polyisoprenyl-teichoic acid--peptidoglycan teichoic acid transferase
VEYLRFRKGVGNDYARMDRQKAVIGQLLSKIKSPAAFGLLPTLISGLQNDVVTNVTPDLVQKMLGSARGLTPHFDTLPTTENDVLGQQIIAGSYLIPNDLEIKAKLETVLTQTPTSSDLVLPTSAPTVVNQSGVPMLGEAMSGFLERRGWLSANVITLEPSSAPTQIMRRPWGDTVSAEFYAKVLGVSVSTPYRYPDGANNIVIFLGKDAGSKYAALALEAKSLAPKP